MKTVLYPGSFDPFTNGHLDLVVRAGLLFDQVIVAIAVNSQKSPMFTMEERIEQFRAHAVLRGLRAFSDFEYELQMALMNRSLRHSCETIFMTPTQENSFVSSHMVKEVAMLGADFRGYVPPAMVPAIEAKIKAMRGAGK